MTGSPPVCHRPCEDQRDLYRICAAVPGVHDVAWRHRGDGQLAARGLSGMYLSAYRRAAIGLTPTQTAEVRRFVEA